MSYKNNIFLLVFISLSIKSFCLAQDITEDVNPSFSIENISEVFTEKIKIISRSGKTFILSNSNQLLNKGDFITLVFKEEGAICRAVVAKIKNDRAGIKVLKVYSLSRWNKIAKGIDVEIIKGDDSQLFVKKKVEEVTPEEAAILAEEDLFNDKGIDEELSSFDTSRRNIKPDNIMSAGYSRISFKNIADTGQEVESFNQLHFSYAYQFIDNYIVEGMFANAQLGDLTGNGLLGVINTYSIKLKYVFKAPLYSFVVPYIGYQSQQANLPQAGKLTGASDKQIENELKLKDNLSQNSVVAGLSIFRRLVPGWFARANLGNDLFSIGISIEF